MNVLLARLGQLETRRTAQAIWNHGKRKKAGREWTCMECKQQSGHKRVYSDATLRWNGSGEPDSEISESETTRREGWGLYSNATTFVGTKPELEDPRAEAGQEDVQSGAFFTSENLHSANEENDGVHRDAGMESLWEQFEADGLVASSSDDAVTKISKLDRVARRARFSRNDLTNLDYKSALAGALAKGEADLVAQCLFAAERAKDADFVGSMSTATFSAILQTLQPENYVSRLASAHVGLSTAMVRHMSITPIRKVAFEYASMLEQVFLIRRSKGQQLSLPDYKLLLRSARDLGDKRLATFMWSALHEDGHRPDTTCFNYYMASVVWNGVHDDVLRKRRRAISHALSRRQTDVSNSRDYRVGAEGVRNEALTTFGNMLKAGVVADEQSFIILITAAAREGDMKTVKSILQKVWDLNVDALLAGTNELKIRPRQIPMDSPIRPTGDFLIALAHVFGMNNDIPAALRVIDFAARQYSIQVPEETWSLLIEWTFVLAVNRTGTSRGDGSKVGELPRQSLTRLWETMTSAPYFVKPTMSMYNFLIKNLSQRTYPEAMSEKMEEAYKIYLNHVATTIASRKELTAAIFTRDKRSPSDVSLESLRKEWEYHDAIRRRDIFWLKRWTRLLLGSMANWSRIDSTFVTERLPPLLWKWRAMAPTTVRYETSTGIVEFEIRTAEDMKRNAKHIDGVRYQNELLREAVPRFVGHEWLQGKLSPRSLRARGPIPADERGDRVMMTEEAQR